MKITDYVRELCEVLKTNDSYSVRIDDKDLMVGEVKEWHHSELQIFSSKYEGVKFYVRDAGDMVLYTDEELFNHSLEMEIIHQPEEIRDMLRSVLDCGRKIKIRLTVALQDKIKEM